MKLRHALALTCMIGTPLMGCSYFDSKLVSSCEEALKKRLVSPSGYKRISAKEDAEPVDWKIYVADEEAKGHLVTSVEKSAFARGKWKPTKYTAILEYDAPNSFNAVVRSLAYCEYFSAAGEVDRVSPFNVEVDGRNSTDYLLDPIKEQLSKQRN